MELGTHHIEELPRRYAALRLPGLFPAHHTPLVPLSRHAHHTVHASLSAPSDANMYVGRLAALVGRVFRAPAVNQRTVLIGRSVVPYMLPCNDEQHHSEKHSLVGVSFSDNG